MGEPRDCTVVACGTLRPELQALAEDGFIDEGNLLFTAPGLHEDPRQLEKQLARQLQKVRSAKRHVIVVYGAKCYVDTVDPMRTIRSLIDEHGNHAHRVNAENCVDMLAGEEERERIAGGDRVYWLTPGWLRHWRYIFREWDTGKANETFPQHDKAILLDAVDFFESYSAEKPDEVLAFSDWMGLPIVPHSISLDRLRGLLSDEAKQQA